MACILLVECLHLPESVDDSSLLSDLHSMVQSAVDCRQ